MWTAQLGCALFTLSVSQPHVIGAEGWAAEEASKARREGDGPERCAGMGVATLISRRSLGYRVRRHLLHHYKQPGRLKQ